MVKRILLIIILIIFILFPPIFPKFLIKGEKEVLKSYFGFVFTYFNKNLERDSFYTFKVKGYEKRGIVLKNEIINKSYIFSSDGKLLSEGDINGAIVVYFKGNNEPKNSYESLKNFYSSFVSFQDFLKKFNFKPYLDLDNGNIYLENDKTFINLGDKNFSERVKNIEILLDKNEINGILDASFDKIILLRGEKKWKICVF